MTRKAKSTRGVAEAGVVVLLLIQLFQQQCNSVLTSNYTRSDFPAEFVFGASTSAFQVEGAAFEDGKTPSIYDIQAHTVLPPPSVSGYSSDIACDQYHKYKEDVKLMVDLGLEAYRFSISWSRLIPNGRGPVNPKGVEYYNNLINELINNGIQPHVTLLHWDLPQSLQDEYEGWNHRHVVKDFVAYADLCFREFGDRVRYWTTINEPNWMVFFCDVGRLGSCISKWDPYIGAHNLLLAHASIVNLYRTKYKEQYGYIGLNVMASWFVPYRDTKEDILATERANAFMIGWFIDPLMYGDYPNIMKSSAGNRLPSFTEDESKLMKNSFDFIDFNNISDKAVQQTLEYFKQEYGNPPIFIHEAGYSWERNASLNDTPRVKYLQASIKGLLEAIRNGSNVRGYFVWALMDVYEVSGNYKTSYGLCYVDFGDPNLPRYPRFSAHWYSRFLKTNNFNPGEVSGQESKLIRSSNYAFSY